jgi:hypothetical protein
MKTVNITLKAHKQIAKLNMASIYEALESLQGWPDIGGVKNLTDMPGLSLANRPIPGLL